MDVHIQKAQPGSQKKAMFGDVSFQATIHLQMPFSSEINRK